MRFDKFFKFPLFFTPWVLLLLVMLAELYAVHYLWAHHIRIWGMSFWITFFLFCFPGLSALYITKRIVLYYGDKLLIGVPSAYEEFVSIRNRFKNFAVILYI